MTGTQRPVLVTGAAGFLGGHVLAESRARNIPVRAMVRTVQDSHALRALGYDTVVADLATGQGIAEAVDGVGAVLHIAALFRQAGLPESSFHAVNAEGTKRLLDAAIAAGASRFVHCSTVGVLGDVKHPPGNEESPLAPGDMYQRSKVAGEEIVRSYFKAGKISGVVIRPAMIYGPGDMRTLKLFRHIQKGTFLYIGRGNASVHFVDARDVARAFYLALERPHLNDRVYIVAGERSLPLSDLAGQIAARLQVRPPWLHLPVRPLQIAGSICEAVCRPLHLNPPIFRRRVDFYTKNRAFDCSRAHEELAFEPRQGIDQELDDIINWYRQHGYLRSSSGMQPLRIMPPRLEEISPADFFSLENSFIVRSIDGDIQYWNRGAEHRYGFPSAEALGSISHNLLKTEFPTDLQEINKELRAHRHWMGELEHICRDGRRVKVTSRWSLTTPHGAAGPVVVEVNRTHETPPGGAGLMAASVLPSITELATLA